jgi:hypothetical protein
MARNRVSQVVGHALKVAIGTVRGGIKMALGRLDGVETGQVINKKDVKNSEGGRAPADMRGETPAAL